jgi:hypothetical protein
MTLDRGFLGSDQPREALAIKGLHAATLKWPHFVPYC